jgi:hypothetical protein
MKMISLVSTALFAGMLSLTALADDRPDADAELIQEFVEYCAEIAEDEGTGDLTLPEFLLVCVNQELESEGYKPVKKLPE